MKIYLKHPRHGKKIAYLQAEADADKKNGWEEYNPEDEVKNVDVENSNRIENESIEEAVEQTEEIEHVQEKWEEKEIEELKAALDEAGISYRKNASKEALVGLLEQVGGCPDVN